MRSHAWSGGIKQGRVRSCAHCISSTPHRPEPYDMRREWPRGQRTDRNKNQVVCEVHFALSPEELETLAQIAAIP